MTIHYLELDVEQRKIKHHPHLWKKLLQKQRYFLWDFKVETIHCRRKSLTTFAQCNLRSSSSSSWLQELIYAQKRNDDTNWLQALPIGYQESARAWDSLTQKIDIICSRLSSKLLLSLLLMELLYAASC